MNTKAVKGFIEFFEYVPSKSLIFKPKVMKVFPEDLKKLKYTSEQADTLVFNAIRTVTEKTETKPLLQLLREKKYIARQVKESVIAGETLAGKSPEDLQLLRRQGIKKVIDFREFESENYRRSCESAGLMYEHCPLMHILGGGKSQTLFVGKCNQEVNQEFVDNLKKLISNINQGNLYMGCNYGIDRTNFAMVLNYVFNPKTMEKVPKLLPSDIGSRRTLLNKNLDTVKKIYKRLSDEQKIQLNLPENFSEIFEQRIRRLSAENRYEPSGRLMDFIYSKIER